jgi:hypothetical protein
MADVLENYIRMEVVAAARMPDAELNERLIDVVHFVSEIGKCPQDIVRELSPRGMLIKIKGLSIVCGKAFFEYGTHEGEVHVGTS